VLVNAIVEKIKDETLLFVCENHERLVLVYREVYGYQKLYENEIYWFNTLSPKK